MKRTRNGYSYKTRERAREKKRHTPIDKQMETNTKSVVDMGVRMNVLRGHIWGSIAFHC